jgi:short-subunit dehydrogenase
VKQKCLEQSKNKILTTDDILVLAYDISDFKKNDEAWKKIIEKFGDIDILIANAGKAAVSVVVDDDFDQVKKLMDVNYFSHVYITKLVIRHWLAIKKRDGLKKLNKQILVTSSLAIVVEKIFTYSYSSTKKCLNTFFNDVAMQHSADGIHVTLTQPGPVMSELANKALPNIREINKEFVRKSQMKMTASRCAHLQLVALSNKL